MSAIAEIDRRFRRAIAAANDLKFEIEQLVDADRTTADLLDAIGDITSSLTTDQGVHITATRRGYP